MFELSVARKYLVPQKKQMSVTLIAFMSVGVISLVVWLVLVFLSVTEGMEKNWLRKLTDLNAPIKLSPTQDYFSSYFYQVDAISDASGYRLKTIGEKEASSTSDPYNPEIDREPPSYWPKKDLDVNGNLKDPVKGVFNILESMRPRHEGFSFQDFEMSGALLKLQMLRPKSSFGIEGETINFLTQVSYIATLPLKSSSLSSLILPPSSKDVNHLFFLAGYRLEGTQNESAPIARELGKEYFQDKLAPLLEHGIIKQLKTSTPHWSLPSSLLSERIELTAFGLKRNGEIALILIPMDAKEPCERPYIKGKIKKENGLLTFESEGRVHLLSSSIPLITQEKLALQAHLNKTNLSSLCRLKDMVFHVKTSLQGRHLEGDIHWDGLEISSYESRQLFSNLPSMAPLWAYFIQEGQSKLAALPSSSHNETGVLLPKSYQDHGVLIGDKGYLSYMATTASSTEEQRLPIFVAGFYDPGLMSVGNKCILAPSSVTRAINSSNSSFAFDKISTNGIQVWFRDLSQTDLVKHEIEKALSDAGIGSYWKVSSYKEYDFAKDLLQQFQSDKNLFSLVGVIIITVACCNIISLLVLLVNDKKKEIGILQAMGASPKSIAIIFGTCGVVVGILGSLIGTIAAIATLHNIGSLVQLLSFLQGHEAFNSAFYGSSLPDTLSTNAVWFVMTVTPLLALLAGLIPALKASFLKPAAILRSES